MEPQNNYPQEDPNELKSKFVFVVVVIVVMLIAKFGLGY